MFSIAKKSLVYFCLQSCCLLLLFTVHWKNFRTSFKTYLKKIKSRSSTSYWHPIFCGGWNRTSWRICPQRESSSFVSSLAQCRSMSCYIQDTISLGHLNRTGHSDLDDFQKSWVFIVQCFRLHSIPGSIIGGSWHGILKSWTHEDHSLYHYWMWWWTLRNAVTIPTSSPQLNRSHDITWHHHVIQHVTHHIYFDIKLKVIRKIFLGSLLKYLGSTIDSIWLLWGKVIDSSMWEVYCSRQDVKRTEKTRAQGAYLLTGGRLTFNLMMSLFDCPIRWLVCWIFWRISWNI